MFGWLRVPMPLVVLVASAAVVNLVPGIHPPAEHRVEQVVTVALVLILFDGGMGIGWRRLRPVLATTATVGVIGTFATAAGAALLLHAVFGLGWYIALLVATAIAPTDPAVVFSVLGQHEIAGPSGTVLEGESGANDPVGIALMASLISAGALTSGVLGQVAGSFALQMGVGACVGLSGGLALRWLVSRLDAAKVWPVLCSLACCLAVFGVAVVAQGSGFLAVFVAGIVVGDLVTGQRGAVHRTHEVLAGVAETVAFVALGATIDVSGLWQVDVLVPGLVLGAVLAFVIRPLAVGACLLPTSLTRNERIFVLFAGLKGAVPILLAEILRVADVPDAERLYGVVVVVVVFSVLVQGSLVPTVATRLGLATR